MCLLRFPTINRRGAYTELDRVHGAHNRLEPGLGLTVGFGRRRASRVQPEFDAALKLGQKTIRHSLESVRGEHEDR